MTVAFADARKRGAPGTSGANRDARLSARRVGGVLVRSDGASMHDLQRARVLNAMFSVVSERGAGSVSVADIVARSGISRRTFYEVFVDREDCFLAGLDNALRLVGARVIPAYEAPGRWQERIRGGLVELLSCLDQQPQVARLLLVDASGMGSGALERRDQVIAHLVKAVDGGREGIRGSRRLPPLTAEGVVGGVLSILQMLVAGEERETLVSLVNPLMAMIVMPYLGHAASTSELDRRVDPSPVAPSSPGAPAVDPFKDAGLRLTYRTVRVLLAVADDPEASNRVVGDIAGIRDQGQISKLLGRLGRLGLIENKGVGQVAGAANAWCLTDAGRSIVSSIRTHTDIATSRGGTKS